MWLDLHLIAEVRLPPGLALAGGIMTATWHAWSCITQLLSGVVLSSLGMHNSKLTCSQDSLLSNHLYTQLLSSSGLFVTKNTYLLSVFISQYNNKKNNNKSPFLFCPPPPKISDGSSGSCSLPYKSQRIIVDGNAHLGGKHKILTGH